ncbi:hypothetical protein PCANB_001152 [Pneumocystis canis]|nr:hypothetical protein PCK1_001106 [Pneumocystis canis]KAG5437175.1 hypothetical protein PCANB_001152 [Pneumocystis canis]
MQFSSEYMRKISDFSHISSIKNAHTTPSFKLEKVSFTYDMIIEVIDLKNNILILALHGGRLLRIDLACPNEIQDLEMPKWHVNMKIQQLFLSPTGQHLLVKIGMNEYVYFNKHTIKGKRLSKFKQHEITCISWNIHETETNTKDILLGCMDGKIFETCIDSGEWEDRYFIKVYQVSDNSEIIGLYMDDLSQNIHQRYIIIITNTRIEYFTGKIASLISNKMSLTVDIFNSGKKGSQTFETINSQFSISPIPFMYNNNVNDRLIGWLSNKSLFYGSLKIFDINPQEIFNFSLTHLSIDTINQELVNFPFFFCFTHYHIIIVQKDEVYIIDRLNNQIVFTEKITLTSEEKILGLITDTYKSTYWIYSREFLYEIVLSNEDGNLWKSFLKNKDYIKALKFAKKNSHYDIIYREYGLDLIKQSKVHEAAKILAKTTLSIEEIALKFINIQDYDALRIYLLEKLGLMKKGAFIQKTILSTWLLFLYITKMNTLDDIQRKNPLFNTSDTVFLENQEIQKEFQEFIDKYKHDLNSDASYYLINSYGRQNELLIYAESINDYAYILQYWIRNRNYDAALVALSKQSHTELIYKYASILILQRPKETVDIWMLHSDIDPSKLIPAIIDYNQQCKPLIEQNQTIRYLFFIIDQTSITEPIIHDTLLSLLASSESQDESSLLQYLEWQKSRKYYNSDFALRTCIQYKRVLSAVYLYSTMGFFEDAVKLALEYNNIDLACISADKTNDQILRKKLWIKIAKKVISQSNEENIKDSFEFLMKNKLLHIEDIISLYPDFIKIDNFKEEICSVLKEYSSNIDSLLKKMEELTQSADNIHRNIEDHNKWFAILNTEERCNICQNMLLNDKFYIFPCQHCFHKDCLYSRILEETTFWQYRQIQDLQSMKFKSENDISMKSPEKREQLEKELDDIISAECILCGSNIVQSIDKSFIDNNSKEMSFWDI